MDIRKLIEDETPLFTAHRWKAYQIGTSIAMLSFNGQLGYDREDFRGWEYNRSASSLSEAVETLIDIYIGLRR